MQKKSMTPWSRLARSAVIVVAAVVVAGCATTTEPDGTPRKEIIYGVTAGNQLISFNAGQPRRLLSKKPLSGLQSGEQMLAIDYRVAKGMLYGLGGSGRLYTINTGSGAVTQVGQGTFGVALNGAEFGFDFNPTVDRIRLVSNSGQNMRLHPDTGAVVDSNANEPGIQVDGNLVYAAGDPNAGKPAQIAAAAYTYNKVNDKITTNYAIDSRLGLLVTQGTREGVTPAVSPNTGQLFTVGSLGVAGSERVAFDIADSTGAAFAAFTQAGATQSRFYLINLDTGATTFLGTIGGGEAVRGISFEP